MHLIRKSIMKGLPLVPAGVLLAAIPLAGCGPTVFQGKTGLAVVGELPPAPPPPAPPKEEPKPPARVVLMKDKIKINEKIQFEKAKANILPVSHSLLDEVVDVLKKNPQVKKVRIEGHASSEGPDAYNMNLSDMRARAVMAYLVSKGVEPTRLEAKGFGETKPIATNDTEQGREKNRRVEFNIVKQESVAKTESAK